MERAGPGARASAPGSFGRVLRQPVLRRVLPAVLVSAVGDGMSAVAVAWLAVQIAPPGAEGVLTGLAVAAYTLPATAGAVVLARLVRRFRGAGLVALDAALHAVALGTVAVLAVTGMLSPAGYVSLLATASLLHAWGVAGTFTLVAEELPEPDQVAGNALLSVSGQAAVIVGPALAGALTALVGAGWVIGADAVSFAVLAVRCWGVRIPGATAAVDATIGPDAANTPDPAECADPTARTDPRPAVDADPRPTAGADPRPTAGADPRPTAGADARPAVDADPAPTGGGWRSLTAQPRLLGLVGVTCGFFFLYGPVEVALPVLVAEEMRGSALLLGGYWATFGVGAVLGGLAAGRLQHHPLWSVVVGIIIGWGAALLPIALSDAIVPGMIGLAVGGLIYGPFVAISTALFQRATPPSLLSRVLAVRTALTTPSVALGTLLGGPVVGALGGRRTLLLSALLTIGFGTAVGAFVAGVRRRAGGAPPPA